MLDPSEILMTHVKALQRAKELRKQAAELYADGRKGEARKLREEAERLSDLAQQLEDEVKPRRPF